jgi:hypothetical protein
MENILRKSQIICEEWKMRQAVNYEHRRLHGVPTGAKSMQKSFMTDKA